MKSNHQSTQHKKFRFGPGTVIAIIAALTVLASGQMFKSDSKPDAERIVYEADAQGKMRRVDAASYKNSSIPKLWKPEAKLAVEHASAIGLDAQQKQRANAINRQWLQEKAQLEEQLKLASAGIDGNLKQIKPEQGVSTRYIAKSLEDYSALSRHYDARRAYYWMQIEALLTKEQLQNLMAKTGGAQ